MAILGSMSKMAPQMATSVRRCFLENNEIKSCTMLSYLSFKYVWQSPLALVFCVFLPLWLFLHFSVYHPCFISLVCLAVFPLVPPTNQLAECPHVCPPVFRCLISFLCMSVVGLVVGLSPLLLGVLYEFAFVLSCYLLPVLLDPGAVLKCNCRIPPPV